MHLKQRRTLRLEIHGLCCLPYAHALCLGEALGQMNPGIFEKWRKYLQLKTSFYLAYAYAYCGEALLAEDKCGDAVRACREAEKCEHQADSCACVDKV